jgi:ubiquinone/menaquinone biosynthesis C-methylase UbiE
MKNPWLEIPYSDYENHMREVGQSQILNALTRSFLEKYAPESFALLGCSTGNGLENITSVTKNVYAIDINPGFLSLTRERFQSRIANLETIQLDIQEEELHLKNIDLFFVGLVLEYVDHKKVLPKIMNTLSKKGILVLVTQQSRQTTFVTKTAYHSLNKLAAISNEIDDQAIISYLKAKKLTLLTRKEIQLTTNKSFTLFEYINGNVG